MKKIILVIFLFFVCILTNQSCSNSAINDSDTLVNSKKILEKIRNNQDIYIKDKTISGDLFFFYINKIKKDLLFENVYINSDLVFENCIFADSISTFFNVGKKTAVCVFLKNVRFQNCTFNKGINFTQSDFKGRFDFSGCKVMGDCDFSGSLFHCGASFMSTNFMNETCFMSSEFFSRTNFMKTFYKSTTNFQHTRFYDVTMFVDSYFYGYTSFESLASFAILDFTNCKFFDKFIATNCNFFGLLKLNKIDCKKDFVYQNNINLRKIDFYQSKFSDSIKFDVNQVNLDNKFIIN